MRWSWAWEEGFCGIRLVDVIGLSEEACSSVGSVVGQLELGYPINPQFRQNSMPSNWTYCKQLFLILIIGTSGFLISTWRHTLAKRPLSFATIFSFPYLVASPCEDISVVEIKGRSGRRAHTIVVVVLSVMGLNSGCQRRVVIYCPLTNQRLPTMIFVKSSSSWKGARKKSWHPYQSNS